ncbi:MAG: nitroreductase family protein [Oscillospiraceae bacterium]|nr:nitroreductase family protein [Oscillospiraceae bacterium]
MKKTVRKATSLVLLVAVLVALLACGSASAFAENAETGSTAVDTIMTAGTTQAFTDDPVPEEDIQTILQAGLASESAINQQPWFFVAITDQDVMAELSSSAGRPAGGTMPAAKDGEMPDFSKGGEMPDFPKDGEIPDFPQNGEMPEFPGNGEKPDFPQNGEKPAAPQGGAPTAMSGGSAKAALGDSPLAIIVYMDESTSSPNPAFDCGLAVQNMYIAAASLGYGAKIISSPTMSLNGENHDQICEKLGVDTSLTAVAVLLVGKADQTVDGVSGATTRSGLDEKTVIVG